MNEEFEDWWKVENKWFTDNGIEKGIANIAWKVAYNQGIEDAAKTMEHNSMHCAALIREIKK